MDRAEVSLSSMKGKMHDGPAQHGLSGQCAQRLNGAWGNYSMLIGLLRVQCIQTFPFWIWELREVQDEPVPFGQAWRHCESCSHVASIGYNCIVINVVFMLLSLYFVILHRYLVRYNKYTSYNHSLSESFAAKCMTYHKFCAVCLTLCQNPMVLVVLALFDINWNFQFHIQYYSSDPVYHHSCWSC